MGYSCLDFNRCPVCTNFKTKFSLLMPLVQQFYSLKAISLACLLCYIYLCQAVTCLRCDRPCLVHGNLTLPLPEVLRIWACKLILIIELGWCCRVSTPSCFLFLCFSPALTELPLEEVQNLKGKNGLHCSNGAIVERKQRLFFFEEGNNGLQYQ